MCGRAEREFTSIFLCVGHMNLRTAVASFLLLLVSTSSHAQFKHRNGAAAETSLSIAVRSSQDAPAPNARVEVHDMSGMMVASGYTNANGIMEVLARLSNGNYDVVATQGLSEAREHLLVSEGGMASITVRLPSDSDQDKGVGGRATVSVAQYKVPDKARKFFRKAQEALEKSEFDEAGENLRKALEIYPKFAEALCLRGVLKIDRQDRDGAIADLDEAIHIDSSYATSYFALGAVYNLMSRFDDAIRTLDYGITISPTAWQGYFEMAKAQIGKTNYQAALRQLNRAQALIREDYPLINLLKGHTLLALKQYPEAMVELEAFLQKAPKDPQSDAARQLLARAKTFANTQQ